MEANELHVFRSAEAADAVDVPAVAIESLARDATAEEIQSMFVEFSLAEVESDTRLPLYELLWFTITGPDESLDGLIDFVVVFEGLSASIADTRPEALVVREGVDERFTPVLRDVATAHGLALREAATGGARISRALVGEYVRIGLIMLDHLVTSVLGVVSRTNYETDVVFFPQTGREDNVIPVLEAGTFDFTVVVYPLFQLFRRGYLADRGLADYPTRAFDAYGGLGTIAAELRFIVEFTRSLLGTPRLESELTDHVEETYGCHMPRAVRRACRETYGRKLSKCLSVPIGRAMIERTDCEAVVVGSSGLPSRGILYAAREYDVDTYLIPHGITRPHEPLVPKDTTMFVPGEFGEDYLGDVFPAERQPRFVATGRPYLQAQYHDGSYSGTDPGEDGPLRIVLATQNFTDAVRADLFSTTLAALGERSETTELVVKIHPSETLDLYRDLLQTCTVPANVDLTLADDRLEHYLDWGDLLVTVNSNVGLESIIHGTPTLAINLWEPTIPNYVYVEVGPVPCLETTEAVESFFRSIDRERVADLKDAELRWFNENYVLETDAARAIADRIDPGKRE